MTLKSLRVYLSFGIALFAAVKSEATVSLRSLEIFRFVWHPILLTDFVDRITPMNFNEDLNELAITQNLGKTNAFCHRCRA